MDVQIQLLPLFLNANGTMVEYSIDNVTFQPTGEFMGLDAGVYIIYMRNAIGCTSQTGELTLSGLVEISDVVITPTNCGESTGALEITGVGTMIEYSIDNMTFSTVNTFTDLAPGDFTVYLRDADMCVRDTTITIPNSGLTSITDVVATPTSCGDANGSITITGTSESGVFEYSIDGVNFQNGNNLFENVAGGTYTAYLRDEFGCTSEQMIEVPTSEDISIRLITTNEICDGRNGTVEVVAEGGVGNFQYRLEGDPFVPNNTFQNLDAGDYIVEVTDDVGCMRQMPFTLFNACEVGIASAITPNGNGMNDRHRLIFDVPIQVHVYQVYDRWGEKVWESKDFLSTSDANWWDGLNDGELALGTYLYRVEYTFNGQEVKKEGTVTVIR